MNDLPAEDQDRVDRVLEEIKALQRYKKLVLFIANDYCELSHDKVKWQRDDWMKRCRDLRDELEKD